VQSSSSWQASPAIGFKRQVMFLPAQTFPEAQPIKVWFIMKGISLQYPPRAAHVWVSSWHVSCCAQLGAAAIANNNPTTRMIP